MILSSAGLEGPSAQMAFGGVPGYWQTVVRAELNAFVVAVSIAVCSQKSARIWCDNQLVVDRARLIQANAYKVTPLTTDHDLWTKVVELFRDNQPEIAIIKAGSHQDESFASHWQEWAFRHNEKADQLAEFALTTLPSEVLALQKAASRAHSFQGFLKKQLHAHFARVAMMSIQNPEVKKPREPLQSIPDDCFVVDFAVIADNAFQRAPPNLTFDGWVQCLQWLRDLICLMLPKEPQHWYHGMSFCGFFNFSWEKGAFNQFRPITIGDNELQAYDCAKNAHQLSKWITHIIRLSLPDGNHRTLDLQTACFRTG